jgi:molybdopterin/thiamine biosynthesis adenylyltransferase
MTNKPKTLDGVVRRKITIVGVGALGSHVVQALRNEDVTIKVIDFDRVEMKNVASQFHFVKSVRKKKVDALKQAMQFCFGRSIETVGNKLTADNDAALLGDSDLIVDCLDNGEARRVVQNFARANKVPCLHGALAADGGFGRVVWDENFVIDDEAGAGQATCEEGEFLPFIEITASYLAYAVQRFIKDGRKRSFSITPAGVEKI